MQQKLDLIFSETNKLKIDAKDIKKAYKEALDRVPNYRSIVDDMAALREKKKKIEVAVKSEFTNEFDKLNDIELDLSEKAIMTTDITLNKLMKGEAVEVVDDHGVIWEPVFSVKFKKTGVVRAKDSQ